MSEYFAVLHYANVSDMISASLGPDGPGDWSRLGLRNDAEIVSVTTLNYDIDGGFKILVSYRVPDKEPDVRAESSATYGKEIHTVTVEEWLGVYNCKVYGFTAQLRHGDERDHSGCEHLPVYVKRQVQ